MSVSLFWPVTPEWYQLDRLFIFSFLLLVIFVGSMNMTDSYAIIVGHLSILAARLLSHT
jgi:hypothetical protein